MSLLLSSVSSSAIIAGAPAVGYRMNATYIGHSATGTNYSTPTLTFDTTGWYAVALVGSSGGSSSTDSSIEITDIGGHTPIQLGTKENGYDEVTWAVVNITTTGNHQIQFTHQGVDYRRGAANWKLDKPPHLDNSKFYWMINAGTTFDATVYADSVLLGAQTGHATSISLSGLDVEETGNYESNDHYGFYSKTITSDGTNTVTDTSVSVQGNRSTIGMICLRPISESMTHDYSPSYVVMGTPFGSTGLTASKHFLVLGSAYDQPSVMYGKTFVILE